MDSNISDLLKKVDADHKDIIEDEKEKIKDKDKKDA